MIFVDDIVGHDRLERLTIIILYFIQSFDFLIIYLNLFYFPTQPMQYICKISSIVHVTLKFAQIIIYAMIRKQKAINFECDSNWKISPNHESREMFLNCFIIRWSHLLWVAIYRTHALNLILLTFCQRHLCDYGQTRARILPAKQTNRHRTHSLTYKHVRGDSDVTHTRTHTHTHVISERKKKLVKYQKRASKHHTQHMIPTQKYAWRAQAIVYKIFSDFIHIEV